MPSASIEVVKDLQGHHQITSIEIAFSLAETVVTKIHFQSKNMSRTWQACALHVRNHKPHISKDDHGHVQLTFEVDPEFEVALKAMRMARELTPDQFEDAKAKIVALSNAL